MSKLKKAVREEVWNKLDKHCAYCGIPIKYEDMQVDHIIPQINFVNIIKNKQHHRDLVIPKFLYHLTVDHMDHIDNLFPACRVCNKWKSSFNLEFFRREIQAQTKRLRQCSSNYRIAKKYKLIEETDREVVFYFEAKGFTNE